MAAVPRLLFVVALLHLDDLVGWGALALGPAGLAAISDIQFTAVL